VIQLRSSNASPEPARSPRPRLGVLALLALALLPLSLTSCGGTRASRARVTLTSYQDNQPEPVVLTLISQGLVDEQFPPVPPYETATERFYSTKRDSAGSKIVSDEGMGVLLQAFDQSGYDDWVLPGGAPRGKSSGLSKTIEVETDEGLAHVLLKSGMPAEGLQAAVDMVQSFYVVFNATTAYQNVPQKPGEPLFEQPNRPGGLGLRP
jgi:hypothetical protein